MDDSRAVSRSTFGCWYDATTIPKVVVAVIQGHAGFVSATVAILGTSAQDASKRCRALA